MCLNIKTISIPSQVFTGAYLAAVDLLNFVFILFPVCGSKFKSNSGECVAICSCLHSCSHSLSPWTPARHRRMNEPEEGDRALSILRAASGEVPAHLGHQRGRRGCRCQSRSDAGTGTAGKGIPGEENSGQRPGRGWCMALG